MKRVIVSFVVILVVIAAGVGGYVLYRQNAPPAGDHGVPGKPGKHPGEKPAPPTANARPGFCQRDFSDLAARKADIPALRKAGGLVYIFEHKAHIKHPYQCASFYLHQGLNVNAVDPRPDHSHLTGLHYAIKRNDPKMVHFMLDHGASLQTRAGKSNTRPYGYAVFMALRNRKVNRNQVIAILDRAMKKRAADKAASKSGRKAPAGERNSDRESTGPASSS